MAVKIKILMVCESLGGGVLAYVSQLCNGIADNFEVTLVYSTRSQTPEGFRSVFDDGVRLRELSGFGDLSGPAAVARSVKELRRIAAEVSPDLVHLHSSIAGALGRIAFDGKTFPVVYTPHGYAHVLMGPGPKSSAYRFAESVLGRRNATTLTCCQSEDEEAARLTRRHSYIETGLDIGEFDRQLADVEPGHADGRYTVYTLGRACAQKRPALFNRIAELVPEARFLWIGGGELECELTAPNVEVTGWLPRYRALALAEGADAYVLCSYGEAIAMSLLENMHMGALSLVSDVMGNRSVIRDCENGYVCRGAEDFAKRIREVMENPQVASALVVKAREDVRDLYSLEQMVRRYSRFYRDLIEEGA